MSNIAWLTRLERMVVARSNAEEALLEILELGVFVALLAPIRCGRSTLLRGLRQRLEHLRPDALFLLLRPDQSSDLPREVFLNDLLAKLKLQLMTRGVSTKPTGGDPYLELKNTLADLPNHTAGPVVVAIDDLGRVDPRHLKTLLWVFRELHSQRADEGWNGPLGRLAVIVAGSRRLYELTVGGGEDHYMSPFNIAELFHLPDLSLLEVGALVDRMQQDGMVQLGDRASTLEALQTWAGGHPALLKGLLAGIIQRGGRLDATTIPVAAMEVLAHDRTLLTIWERLQGEPEALAAARQVFQEGLRPPDNLEMSSEAVQIVFWFGAIVARHGRFEPRCRMIEVFMAQKLAAEAAPVVDEVPAPVSTRGADRFPPSAFPDGLIHGLSNGAGVLFVGAGASRAAGLPTWADLNREMSERILLSARNDAEQVDLEAYLKSEGPLAVAQLLRDRLGAYEYHRFLVELLRRPAALSSLHHAMRRLPTNLILTTNYDKLLEKTYRLPDGDDPPVVVSTPQLAVIQERSGPQVIKLHGDIDQPETIVLTSDDYAVYFDQHRAMRNFLEYQLSFRTVLFIGFGLRDPNFDLIFEEARRVLAGKGRPAYAIMVGTNPIEANRWRTRGIHIIDLASYDDIPVYLEELALRSTRRP